MSHYFGFGTLEFSKVVADKTMNPKTHLEGSGKFQQNLMLRQKAIEEQMMENRVRKLLKEQENLQKQIEKANKHAELA